MSEDPRKPYEPPAFIYEETLEALATTCTPGPFDPDFKGTVGASNGFNTCGAGFLHT